MFIEGDFENNLKKLIPFIETIPEEDFDMDIYGDFIPKGKSKYECDSPGCILGHVGAYLQEKPDDVGAYFVHEGHWSFLFSDVYAYTLETNTKEQAILRIKAYLKDPTYCQENFRYDWDNPCFINEDLTIV